MQQREPAGQTQATRRESEEHSPDSLNPTGGSRTITKPNTQLQQVRHEEVIQVVEDNLITFTPLPGGESSQENKQKQFQHEPKRQRTLRRKTHNGEWNRNQRHFNQSKNQGISHISPVDQVNDYNIEEPSVSYLQLITGRAADSRFCSKCGKPGHWRKYCQATTWCRLCMSGTHSTRPCRKYMNFVKDDPIASSRRTTPEHPAKVQPQQGASATQLFQPPTQRFQAPTVPPANVGNP